MKKEKDEESSETKEQKQKSQENSCNNTPSIQVYFKVKISLSQEYDVQSILSSCYFVVYHNEIYIEE